MTNSFTELLNENRTANVDERVELDGRKRKGIACKYAHQERDDLKKGGRAIFRHDASENHDRN